MQPGYLSETRGFPSPSHKGFGFIVEEIAFFNDNELIYKYASITDIGIFKINFRKIFAIQDFFWETKYQPSTDILRITAVPLKIREIL